MARARHWLRWVMAGAAVIVVLAVAGPFIYIHFVEGSAPAPLGLTSPSASGNTAGTSGAGSSGTSSGGTSSDGLAGTWRVGTGSVAGYRVKEVLLGQNNLAVGRSHSVTGHLVISGTTLTAATFSVPVTTIHSDQSQRDVQFDGRIMDAAAYPTGTFALTRPVAVGSLPASGAVRTYAVTGSLTLHGHTRPVTFTVSAERAGASLRVSGEIPVLFADWDIPNPSFGSFVTTQNHGILEFLLVLSKS
jgi:polyisoprenoid-binding protein YceI